MTAFAVGYPVIEQREPFVEVLRDFREQVEEVYVAWPGSASGRAAAGRERGYVDWRAQARLEDDLRAIHALGMRIDLLFNASCYGEAAVSQSFEREIGSIIEHLEDDVAPVGAVTTTSPFVARTVKRHFPHIEVRASINMRVAGIAAMSYLCDDFDAFYLQRDLQRNLALLEETHAWCRAQGKRLCILANSGCLHMCPAQAFHDNMVAHDAGIDERKNVPGWTPHLCWRLLEQQEHHHRLLQASWIRPEDLHRYAPHCDLVKLATRMHRSPRLVLQAYAQERFHGNLLDLFEPGHGPALAPRIVDNQAFPAEWAARSGSCDHACHRCGYCAGVFETVCRDVDATLALA